MRLEEARVLADDVHDVRSAADPVSWRDEGAGRSNSHDSLVVLPSLHLRQSKKVCREPGISSGSRQRETTTHP